MSEHSYQNSFYSGPESYSKKTLDKGPSPSTKTREITTAPMEKKADCACGFQDADGINRISGGEEALPKEFPWVVRIVGGCAGGEFFFMFSKSLYWFLLVKKNKSLLTLLPIQ